VVAGRHECRVVRVAPVTVAGGAGILTRFPFAPMYRHRPSRAVAPLMALASRGRGPRGWPIKPVGILTGRSGPADPGACAVAQETYSTSDPKGIAWVIATSTKICSAGGLWPALAGTFQALPRAPSYSSLQVCRGRPGRV